MRLSNNWKDYELLDTSGGERLERWGDHVLVRPDPQAIWKTARTHPGWKRPEGRYSRSHSGGGSWDKVKVPCRLVIPRIDDCISLLLQTTDEPVSNLKKPDHLYVKDKDPDKENFKSIFDHLTKDIDEETKKRYHEDWMRYYREIDIIETEINDSRRPEYAEKVKADADWLQAEMAYVPGGTHLLEKLISGNWDEQFMVFEPGETTRNILI